MSNQQQIDSKKNTKKINEVKIGLVEEEEQQEQKKSQMIEDDEELLLYHEVGCLGEERHKGGAQVSRGS